MSQLLYIVDLAHAAVCNSILSVEGGSDRAP
jgi:hypothetical protein